eukprot:TRINITY_DN17102_c0_g2_i1.p1 TRINITY_DN17102_c0_g2~~TRINITY_DN17102_c0_g2_i1.p1  ORF type:complete len:1017 (+),score=196.23 TRINITY_DN17102_c0_g2_i1:457-3051(+)
MDAKELLNFVNPARAHIIQSLFEVDEGFDSMEGFRKHSFRMRREVIAALVGAALSTDELLRIDKTALAEVLAEDGLVPDAAAAADEAGCDPVRAELAEMAALDMDADELLACLRRDVAPKPAAVPAADVSPSPSPVEDTEDASTLGPYTDDMDYLADHFQVVATRMRVYALAMQDEASPLATAQQKRPDVRLRELRAQERAAMGRCQARLAATPSPSQTIRVERLKQLRRLTEFETWVVITLIGGIVSQEVRRIGSESRLSQTVSFAVGTLIGVHLPDDLHKQMAQRRSFYRQAPLVRSGIVRVANRSALGTGDLMDCSVEMDRRMLDFCVGLDTEFCELVDAANLYQPSVSLDRVILPEALKSLIVGTVENYARFRAYRKRVGLEDLLEYGRGIVLLFHGLPGTGKTMMANALANHLGKKLLLVTLPLFSENPPDALRQVFREAAIQDAIVFFDECDALFETREKSKFVTLLLSELEHYDGLLILATNCASELDEAMHRRITLTLNFPPPDPFLREKIWKGHIPPEMKTGDVDWGQLSMDYELCGGFIKNAVLAAISLAVARSKDDSDIMIEGEDLKEACKLQIRSQLRAAGGSERRITPQRGLSSLVLPEDQMANIRRIIDYERARRVLQVQWGFDAEGSHFASDCGTTVVFAGPRGTGKTLAAEAIAHELARPLRVMNVLEVITTYRTSQRNAATLFDEARTSRSVLALEGAEALLDSEHRLDSSNGPAAAFLMFQVERAGGVVILSVTTPPDRAQSPSVPPHRLKFEVTFPLPDAGMRTRLWQTMLPRGAPVADDVDWRALGSEFALDGATIRAALLRAAAAAALRGRGSLPITMADLREAAAAERDHAKKSAAARTMYM